MAWTLLISCFITPTVLGFAALYGAAPLGEVWFGHEVSIRHLHLPALSRVWLARSLPTIDVVRYITNKPSIPHFMM